MNPTNILKLAYLLPGNVKQPFDMKAFEKKACEEIRKKIFMKYGEFISMRLCKDLSPIVTAYLSAGPEVTCRKCKIVFELMCSIQLARFLHFGKKRNRPHPLEWIPNHLDPHPRELLYYCRSCKTSFTNKDNAFVGKRTWQKRRKEKKRERMLY